MEQMTEPILAELVAHQVNVPPEGIRLERCRTGKHNETWFVSVGYRDLVLRLAPPDDRRQMLFYEYRMMRQEPELHHLLRRRTTVPVPEILAADFTHEWLDRDYLLMERLQGVPLSDCALSARQFHEVLHQVGDALRQVHAITGEKYGYCGAHEPMPPQPDWASAFSVMWNKLVDDIVRCGGYSTEEADFIRRQLDEHLAAFDRPIPASLLHMDIWAQNLLADDSGKRTGILDWDRALWGDPEIEFAVLDYCGISEPAFWEGYGAERDDTPEARLRHRFYLLYELQKHIFIRRVRRNRPDEAEQFRRHCLEMANAIR
jgi:aminoglycoside phosphotransferase (APT) family kinase protein